MKKLLLILLMAPLTVFYSQDDNPEVKYRRSSLHTMLIETDRMPKKDTVIGAFTDMPFPDKYNEHTIAARSFNPYDFQLTDEERAAIPELNKEKSKLGALAGDVVQEALTEEEILAKRINSNC